MNNKKKVFTKKRLLSIFGFILIIALFIILSNLTKNYSDYIRNFIGDDYLGMIIYVFLIALEGILAPLSFIPLIAIASNLWGWVVTGILNFIGWSIAAVFVYWFVRRYGICLIRNIIPLEKIAVIDSYIPENHIFLSLIFLRIIFPSDVLNYAISLLTNIKFKIYFWSALIGGIPFSFGIAYLGVIPLAYQISFFSAGIFFIFIVIYFASKNKKRIKRLKKIEKRIKKEQAEACDI